MARTGRRIRHYTEEELQNLTEWYLSYVPTGEIANRLNRDEGTVRQKILKLGLRRTNIISKALKWAPPELAQKLKDGQTAEEQFLIACYEWRLEEQAKNAALKQQGYEDHQKELDHRANEIDQMAGMSRREKMVAKRLAGLTLEAIGRQHGGITRERVRQLTDPKNLGRNLGPGRPRKINKTDTVGQLAQLKADQSKLEEQLLNDLKTLWGSAPVTIKDEFLAWLRNQNAEAPNTPSD